MKKKLSLRRESISQLTATNLRNVNGGIQTNSVSCPSNACPHQTDDCTNTTANCSTSVSTVVRLTQHYGC